MPTLRLEVSEELQRFLARSGRPEQQAVELLEEARVAHDEVFRDPANVARLRDAVAVGAEQFERGETVEFTAESVIAEAHAHHRQRKGE